jgi:hypothetical protein
MGVTSIPGGAADDPYPSAPPAPRHAGEPDPDRRGAAPALRPAPRGGRLRGAGAAARADGLGAVPAGAGRRAGRRGRLPGHLPRPAPEGRIDPRARFHRELAVRGRGPHRPQGAGERRPEARGGAAGFWAAPAGRPVGGRRSGGGRDRGGGAGEVAGTLPGASGAVWPGWAEQGGGGPAPGLQGGDGGEPPGPGPRAAAGPAVPPRRGRPGGGRRAADGRDFTGGRAGSPGFSNGAGRGGVPRGGGPDDAGGDAGERRGRDGGGEAEGDGRAPCGAGRRGRGPARPPRSAGGGRTRGAAARAWAEAEGPGARACRRLRRPAAARGAGPHGDRAAAPDEPPGGVRTGREVSHHRGHGLPDRHLGFSHGEVPARSTDGGNGRHRLCRDQPGPRWPGSGRLGLHATVAAPRLGGAHGKETRPGFAIRWRAGRGSRRTGRQGRGRHDRRRQQGIRPHLGPRQGHRTPVAGAEVHRFFHRLLPGRQAPGHGRRQGQRPPCVGCRHWQVAPPHRLRNRLSPCLFPRQQDPRRDVPVPRGETVEPGHGEGTGHFPGDPSLPHLRRGLFSGRQAARHGGTERLRPVGRGHRQGTPLAPGRVGPVAGVRARRQDPGRLGRQPRAALGRGHGQAAPRPDGTRRAGGHPHRVAGRASPGIRFQRPCDLPLGRRHGEAPPPVPRIQDRLLERLVFTRQQTARNRRRWGCPPLGNDHGEGEAALSRRGAGPEESYA